MLVHDVDGHRATAEATQTATSTGTARCTTTTAAEQKASQGTTDAGRRDDRCRLAERGKGCGRAWQLLRELRNPVQGCLQRAVDLFEDAAARDVGFVADLLRLEGCTARYDAKVLCYGLSVVFAHLAQ